MHLSRSPLERLLWKSSQHGGAVLNHLQTYQPEQPTEFFTSWLAEFSLTRPIQLYLPGFIHHAVPTVAISQIESNGQFLL